jgi:hypothetical protein
MVMFRRLVMVLRGTDVMGAGRMLCCHAVRFPSQDIKCRRAAGPGGCHQLYCARGGPRHEGIVTSRPLLVARALP